LAIDAWGEAPTSARLLRRRFLPECIFPTR